MYSRIHFDIRFCRPVVVHETPWNTKSRGNVTVRSYFILDVFVNFRTSYIDDMTNVITDNKMIARNYILGWFAIDFVSCVPVNYVLLITHDKVRLATVATARPATHHRYARDARRRHNTMS